MIDTDHKTILERFINTIPSIVYGTEKINFILDNVEKISPNERIILRHALNKMLTSMIEREASDIEIGGYGNGGFVWLRVFGSKERVKEFPRFTEDEATVLIANLLNKNQHRYLITTKNLDFSYTFYYERKKIEARFRACAYYDLESLALNMMAISTEVRSLESL